MKNLFFLLILLLFSVFSFGQITIDRNDYYGVGTVIPTIFKEDTILKAQFLNNNNVELVVSGFSNLDTQIDLYFYDKADFSAADTFPSASVAFIQEFNGQSAIFYEQITENESSILGVQIEVPFIGSRCIVLDNPLILESFPFSYSNYTTNSESSGSFKIPISDFSEIIPSTYQSILAAFDTVRGLIEITKSSLYDDYGQIKLAGNFLESGTYDYLREYRILYFSFNLQMRNKLFGTWTDLGPILSSINASFPELPIVQTTNNLLYWTKSMEYPIVDILLSEDTTQITKITARCDASNINVDSYEILSQIYPNPVKTHFFITENINNIKSITIFSINGKKLKEEKITSEEINVSDLSSGIYFYRLNYINGKTNKIGKIIKH